MKTVLTAYVVAQMADAVTFWWMMGNGGQEGNPFVLMLVATGGVALALVAKLALVLIGVYMTVVAARANWRYPVVLVLLFGVALGFFGAWTNVQ